MKTNKKYIKMAMITLAVVGTSYALGKQQGEQTILDRWENRWFDSEWYDTQSIEDILLDTDYSIELGD
tara:strand:+ start:122 stop:325 length:204 start_codon:yes stop_codon:yes gene_type:complete